MTIAICAIDIGSINRGNLGWAVRAPNQDRMIVGTDLDAFVDAVASASRHWPIALGFEAPLFIPFRAIANDLHKGRRGEGSPSWIGKVGCLVATQCLPIMAYTFSKIGQLAPPGSVTLDASAMPMRAGDFLIFEAFVAGRGKLRHRSGEYQTHTADAVCVVTELHERISSKVPLRSDLLEEDVFSLVGAALLRSGWSNDIGLLHQRCLVVRP